MKLIINVIIKMQSLKLIFVSYLLFVILTNYSFSQLKSEQKVFTLEQCLEIALNNNYEVQAANAQVVAANADITNAFGKFLPSINFDAGYNRQLNMKGITWVDSYGNVHGSNPNSYNMSAIASYAIFNGFSRTANYSRAQDAYDASYANSRYISQKIKLNVYRQFIDIVKKAQILKTRQENLELGKKELERIQAQYDAGVIPIANVYSQEAELGNREYELTISENDLNVSKVKLLNIMGIRTDNEADFLESSIKTNTNDNDITNFRTSIGSINSSINQAFKLRQDYISLQSELSANKSNLTISKSGYYPSISASGGWSWSNTTLDNFSELGRSYIGLNFSVPIFDNFNTSYRSETAFYQLKQKEIEKYQLEQSIRTDVQTCYMNLDAAEKQLEITKRALRAAEQNFESFKERFRIGSSNITDYLTANNQLITSQINRINSIYNYLQAQKEIMFAIGKLE
ncbi:MAG: TolC family protein [Ignavibacteriae bacterium]|nr:TolC family protein [Ignavibacteriota bacterium]